MKSFPVVQIVNPEDPESSIVINESDFDPDAHSLFDPMQAHSLKVKRLEKEKAARAAEKQPAAKKAPAKKASAKKAPAKRAAKK